MPLAPPAWVQAPPAPAPVQDPAQAAVQAPALPFTSLRARYKWALEVGEDRGSGSLTLRLAPATGELVVEVFSFTDRLALVAGDAARGYHLILPREQVDRTVASVSDLPFPFLPQAGSVEARAGPRLRGRRGHHGDGAGCLGTQEPELRGTGRGGPPREGAADPEAVGAGPLGRPAAPSGYFGIVPVRSQRVRVKKWERASPMSLATSRGPLGTVPSS